MKFSLCMIVKNEEKVLERCLESLKDIMDEMIIVDTGSTDGTKDIAKRYTDQIYDFEWVNDFSAARNFAFSKATGDYIYSADADEYLDEENRLRLKTLKAVLMPEVEMVQMIYVTSQANHPTENFERDYRPKLFKRLRTFTWIDPIHEIVNLNPVVFDSDVEIIHCPQGNHSGRDFRVFERVIEEKGRLPERLITMYVRELYKAGELEDLQKASTYLEKALQQINPEKVELIRQVIAVLLRFYRMTDQQVKMLKLSLRDEATIPSAEICMELGYFFLNKEEYEEAAKWFYRAAFECECEIDIASSGTSALQSLALCYRKMTLEPTLKALPAAEYEMEKARLEEKAAEYEEMARNWKPQTLDI